MTRRLVLNANTLGLGQRQAAWNAGGQPAHALVGPEYWRSLARTAERGLLDALFLADAPLLAEDPSDRATGNLDPTITLAFVAQTTERIGLVATASSTYNDPVELARRMATVDVLSGGRAAWNVVTTYAPGAGANFGIEGTPPREERYARADAFVASVRALWRGEAVEGESLDAALHGERPILQAGGSPQGRALAAKHADAVFTAEMDRAAAAEHYRQVVDAAAAHGRRPRILPGLSLTLGSTEREAQQRFDDTERLGPEGYGLHRLAGILGPGLLEAPLDGPVPESLLRDEADAGFAGSLGFRESMVRFVRETRPTVAELVRLDGGFGHRSIVGTPDQAADLIEEWFTAGIADGFNLMPGVLPQGLEEFVDHVVPLLQARGLFRREYAETRLTERWARLAP